VTISGLNLKWIKKMSLGVVKFFILYFNVGEKNVNTLKELF